jgi:GR25 family glycosyltransferase involved in LPS biosynthesis
MKRYVIYISIIILICSVILSSRTLLNYEDFAHIQGSIDEQYDIKSWVINLDRNKTRWYNVSASYAKSDISKINIQRYPAIVGKDLKPELYLSKSALQEFNDCQKRGYRTRHYQLSVGGIGCFVSHYNIFKILLETDNDMFLIFEDDVIFPKHCMSRLQDILKNAPKDWDIILLGFSRLHGYKINNEFIKPNGFWGTSSYITNKRGAIKFINECDVHKIDAQIDAYMSYLSQTNKLNIYAIVDRLITIADEGSDIQFQGVKAENGENPFMYKGYIV